MNSAVEIAFCFQMLAFNKNILDASNFDELFVNSKAKHINREILTRRIYGLVQIAETGEADADLPKLHPLKLHELRLPSSQQAKYEVQKRKEGFKDSFMQGSRQISNCITY